MPRAANLYWLTRQRGHANRRSTTVNWQRPCRPQPVSNTQVPCCRSKVFLFLQMAIPLFLMPMANNGAATLILTKLPKTTRHLLQVHAAVVVAGAVGVDAV